MTAANILACVVPAILGLGAVYVISLIIAAVKSGFAKDKKPFL